jgi:hypothetical protein
MVVRIWCVVPVVIQPKKISKIETKDRKKPLAISFPLSSRGMWYVDSIRHRSSSMVIEAKKELVKIETKEKREKKYHWGFHHPTIVPSFVVCR